MVPTPPVHPYRPSPESPRDRKIQFSCSSCGTTLAIDAGLAGTSGPCPVCGTVISSPGIRRRRSMSDVPARSKARIAPDAIVDQTHQLNRESVKSIKVVVLFILTLSVCVAVAWILKQHLAR